MHPIWTLNALLSIVLKTNGVLLCFPSKHQLRMSRLSCAPVLAAVRSDFRCRTPRVEGRIRTRVEEPACSASFLEEPLSPDEFESTSTDAHSRRVGREGAPACAASAAAKPLNPYELESISAIEEHAAIPSNENNQEENRQIRMLVGPALLGVLIDPFLRSAQR